MREAAAKVGVSARHALGISYLKLGHRKKSSRTHRDASSSSSEWKCLEGGSVRGITARNTGTLCSSLLESGRCWCSSYSPN